MSDLTYIYGLIDPRDRSLFYVGKSNRPHARLRQHINEARGSSKHAKSIRILEILDAGSEPELVVLESIEQSGSVVAEERWIAAYRSRGILNVRDTCAFTKTSTRWHETHVGWSNSMTADDLRAVRAERGWSQADLARYVGVSPAAVSRWEAGGRRIPNAVARLLVHDT